MFNVFEQPWTMLAVAVVTVPVLRVIFREKRYWWKWLLPLLLAGSGFALDFFVQTDLEKIKAVLQTAAMAVEQEKPDAFERIIAENYRDSYHNSKSRLMRRCRNKLSEPLAEKTIARVVSIQMADAGTTATVVFTMRILFDKQSEVYQNYRQLMFVKAKLQMQKEPAGNWLINRIEIIEIDRQPAKWQHINY